MIDPDSPSPFLWRPSYASGDPRVDSQHRCLLDLADLVHRALSGSEPGLVLHHAVDALRLYAQTHFADEERWLAEIAAPGLIEHRANHRRLAEELEAILAGLSRDGGGCELDRLWRWMTSHIVTHLLVDDRNAFGHAAGDQPSPTG